MRESYIEKRLAIKVKNHHTEITESKPNKTHKYLGINEANSINHTINKEKKFNL